MNVRGSGRLEWWAVWLGALIGPPLLTAVLLGAGSQQQRDYVFLYLALVAILGVFGGFWPAIAAAGVSFLLVDYYFVPPVGTFTIADRQDIVNLLAFAATAGLVGLLASRRRLALLESEAMAVQLREANSELVRLNREQAAAAQAALRLARSEQQVRALQETDRLRRDLLANVSHELRTPLATILTESTDSSALGSAAETEQRLETIAAEARRLKGLVDDMLDLARIEGGALELDFEPILVSDAIAAAAERLHRSSPDRAVDWDQQSSSVAALGDWDRVGQVFDNLLANAARFSPADASITVKVHREEPGLITIRVIDRGPGVAPELRERLFERFLHGEAVSDLNRPAGSGLGLAIVKGVVEGHAGTVSLEASGAGEGAVFKFTLPEAPAEP